MDDFGDDLLLQIFRRVLCYKSLTLCKYVSKHWLSLLPPSNTNCLRWAFMSNALNSEKLPCYHCLILSLEEDHENLFNLRLLTSVDFLPKEARSIVGTWRDLILCHGTDKSGKMEFYLCNPLSKQWFPIPNTPQFLGGFAAGFVFKSERDDCSCGKFRVVLVSKSSNSRGRLNLHMFCSEIGQWRELKIDFPSRFYMYRTTGSNWFHIQGMVCNGMIHLERWRTGDFVAFDPFKVPLSNSGCDLVNITDQCYFVDAPLMSGQVTRMRGKVVEAQNRVVYINIRLDEGSSKKVQVWELKDYNSSGVWESIHEVKFNQMVSVDVSINKFLSRFCSLDRSLITCSSYLMSVDNNDCDIVYMVLNDELTYKLVSCHLPTMAVRFIRTMNFEKPSDAFEFCDYSGRYVFVLPSKPTPIPSSRKYL